MTEFNKSMYSYLIDRTSHLPKTNKMWSFYGGHIDREHFIKEVEKVAAFLQALQVKKGDNVILCLGNIPNAIICFYAINKIGAIANVLHPLIKDEALREIYYKMNPKALIMFDEFYNNYSLLHEISEPVILCGAKDYLPKIFQVLYPVLSYKALKNLKPTGNVIRYSDIRLGVSKPVEILGDDIAIYMHSSGTTGEPKTACLSNDSYNHIADNTLEIIGGNKNDKTGMLMALPIFHTYGLGVCMHTVLCGGMQVVLMPKFDPNYASLLMILRPVNMISGTPNMYRKMSDSIFFKGRKLKKLQHCFCGGDKLSQTIKEKFEGACKRAGNNFKIEEGYGLTEAGICAVNIIANAKDNSIGIPLKGNKFKIVGENGEELGCNKNGIIYIASNSLMSGYYNDESATNETLIKDANGVVWLKTGDYGYIDESGHIFFVDREKRLIKISGINVFPQEIENVVNVLDGIKNSCAVKIIKNNKVFIKLFVQMEEGFELTQKVKEEIGSSIAAKLLKYSLPNEIVAIKEFPLTKIGKIDYKKLEIENK